MNDRSGRNLPTPNVIGVESIERHQSHLANIKDLSFFVGSHLRFSTVKCDDVIKKFFVENLFICSLQYTQRF
jgi:hypothetical protein